MAMANIKSKEDIINDWAQTLEDMDLSCDECPVKKVCDILTCHIDSCKKALKKAFDVLDYIYDERR